MKLAATSASKLEENKMTEQFHILINAHSGTAQHCDHGMIMKHIEESGLSVASLDYAEKDAFFEKLDALSDDETPTLVGGGDGSLAYAAQMFLKTQRAFGILPFGTMNMLAKDLGVPEKLGQMFKAYRHTQVKEIDVGRVNERPFFCAAALGVMPEASVLREQTRDEPEIIAMPKLSAFVLEALDKSHQRQLRLTIDNQKKFTTAASIVVSNNIFERSDFWEDDHFKKHSLTQGRLGLYTAAPQSFWDKLHLLLTLRFGAWLDDPSLQEYQGKTARIDTNKNEELISLDGEPVRIETPLIFDIMPKALKVIVPVAPT
jgi:diacylglycerol kinase family enzyme